MSRRQPVAEPATWRDGAASRPRVESSPVTSWLLKRISCVGRPASRSDHELLERDFGAFYDRHLAAVAAFVGGRVRAPDVAFDLVAETFARALEKRAQYDPARAPAVAWLLGIARHLIVDAARQGQVESTSRARLGMEPVELFDEQLVARALGAAVKSGGRAMTNDPYQDLRAELVSAAARLDGASAPRGRRSWWWRWRRRPLVIVIAALVICGSAAAAVVSLNATRSQPLAGNVPGTIVANPRAGSIAGYRYRIGVTPALTAGAPGWTTSISYTNPATGLSGGGASGGGGYPTRADPVLQGSELELISTRNGHHAETVGWVLTGPAVAAVRVGRQTIQTFRSPQLPAGDRAAVYFLPPGPGQPPVSLREGQSSGELMFSGSAGQTGTEQPIPLGRDGAPIATAPMSPTSGAPGTFWQAKTALTPNIHEPPYHGPARPRPGVCELAQRGLPGLTPEWGRTITSIPSATDAAGELFVSCVDTEYYLSGTPLDAGVLLDARHPGDTLGSLPGTQPVAGNRNLVNDNVTHISAKRIGNAWLVIKGGYTADQRLRVLQALRISTLDLHRTAPTTRS